MEEAQSCDEWTQRDPGPARFYCVSCPGQSPPLPAPCAYCFSSSPHFFLSLSPVLSPSEYTFFLQKFPLSLRLSMTTPSHDDHRDKEATSISICIRESRGEVAPLCRPAGLFSPVLRKPALGWACGRHMLERFGPESSRESTRNKHIPFPFVPTFIFLPSEEKGENMNELQNGESLKPYKV